MNKVVVITGASAGVGRATAIEFATQGAWVGLLARGAQRLDEAKRDVERHGGRAVAMVTDVADAEQVERAAERIERELGPIDIWINNAMTTVFASFQDITAAEFRRATEVTYLGVVYGTMAALRRMEARRRGTIVQVGSALAYRAIPLQSPYCGAKFAIRGFTDSLRCELIHRNSPIHLTMVQLPALNTPQFSWCKTKLPKHPQPVPPIFQPEVAARAIAWAAHHHRREVHLGWPTVQAIWGNKIAPGFADRRLARQGYEGQQADMPVDEDRPANLFEPIAAEFGAHGIFDQRAHTSSRQWWFTTHHPWIFGIAAALLAVFVLLVDLVV